MKSKMRAVVFLVITFLLSTMSTARAEGMGLFDPMQFQNNPTKYKEAVSFMTQMMTERLEDLKQGNAVINQLEENIRLYEQKSKDTLNDETKRKLSERYTRVVIQLKEWRQLESEFKAKQLVLQKYFEIYDRAKNYPRAIRMKQAQIKGIRSFTQHQELTKAVMSNYILLAEEVYLTLERK